MSDNYFNSWSSSHFGSHYAPEVINRNSQLGRFAQSQITSNFGSNDSSPHSSLFGMPQQSPLFNSNETHRQLHFSETTSPMPVRRVVNLGACPGTGHSSANFLPLEQQINQNVPNMNHQFIQNSYCQPNMQGFSDMNEFGDVPRPRLQTFTERGDSQSQEPTFQMMLSQQILREGFSIRNFLEHKTGATETADNAKLQSTTPGVFTIDSRLYADETEESLFAVVYLSFSLVKLCLILIFTQMFVFKVVKCDQSFIHGNIQGPVAKQCTTDTCCFSNVDWKSCPYWHEGTQNYADSRTL